VHNGIISNHSDIKNTYLSDVKFTSETDTEVIAQFIALQLYQGKNMIEALQFFGSIAGKASQWGLVIVDRDQPDKIYTYTHGSPLLIGFSPE
jgi:glucosamine--fructose-6-phosphate aminotransferase (isomerizing)